MEKTRKIIWLISMLLIGVSLSCSDDNEPEEIIEEKKPLVDKADSVFIDNGEYIAVNTVFTDEEALAILDSTAWAKYAYEYIYDTYNIEQYYETGKFIPSYWIFGKNSYFSQSLTSSGGQTFKVKNKQLIVKYEDYVWEVGGTEYTYTIVGIDSACLVVDSKFTYIEGWTTPFFKKYASSPEAKRRHVYKRYKGKFVIETESSEEE